MSIYCGQEASKQGTSGTSGCSGHYDYAGPSYLKGNVNTPDCVSKIIHFRNDMKCKEYMSSFEHDVHGGTQAECVERGKIMLDRVNKKLKEIDKRYDILDKAILDMAEIIGEKIIVYDTRMNYDYTKDVVVSL